ncbi:DUF3310 domain-containing protein [uncultured Megasphaera sp.]|uniref:DUF3310 domain-containing protein n=1 Tax=uncultured Megasphaera sp. TaxID=165188 RepID=UPI002629F987|nr:DUF3310 domain-containing protein [uncultured Megasphaera sp.]
MSNSKKVLRDYETVRVDVRNFNAIDGDYVYGEIQRNMDIAGVLCYEVRLRGTDTYIVVNADRVQEVGEYDKHDKHYLESVVEPIKVMEKLFTKEELKGFIKGNILKYRLRMGHKDDIQKEMDKIRVYEQWLAKLERGEALTDAD